MKIKHSISALALAALAGSALAGVSFGPRTDIAAAQRPSSSVVADFNGDGLRDLAVTTDTSIDPPPAIATRRPSAERAQARAGRSRAMRRSRRPEAAP